MGHKFAEIAFTDSVKKEQEKQRSRANYATMEQGEDFNYLLSQQEADYIHARDSFYMASVSETDWPYVQHRGGPIGFLKVIDEKTIGFADYTGNKQYVSTGNFKKNDRVSLILMDYPNRRRLKILGRISIICEDDTTTLAMLEDDNYRVKIERGFIIHIEAFDWNCPKHITPKYTETDIEKMLAPLVAENESLKTSQSDHGVSSALPYPMNLGDGPLNLVITAIRQLTDNVRAYELRSATKEQLPPVSAGSHISIPVQLKNGTVITRQYSICSNPARRDIYEIAVQKEADGKGGSQAVHDNFTLGLQLNCQPVKNHFPLQLDERPVVLIAGGIGITPIKAMAQALKANGKYFQVHYAGKSRDTMPFLDRLEREFNTDINCYFSDANNRLDINAIIANAPPNAMFYLCGPDRLISAFTLSAKQQFIVPERIHSERFSTTISTDAKPITITLKQSNKTIEVSEKTTLLDALLEADVAIAFSCQTGSCKSCVVKVLNGEAEHFDMVLTEQEKKIENLMCPCVSRAKTSHLTLDI
jgi:ferredoxin-NADP reductase